MITVSAAFLEQMRTRTDFAQNARITFQNGSYLDLEGDDFTFSNNSITDGAGQSSFPVGFAVEKTIQLELTNYDDRYADYDFFGATILLYLDYRLSGGTTERINYGYYIVVTPETYGETVILTAVDEMYRADGTFRTNLTFPVTAGTLLRDICISCGLTLGSVSFLHDDISIPELPDGEYTYRQMIGYIAMMAAGNARIGYDGRLYISTFDISAASLYTLDKWIGKPRISTDDITITGIQMEFPADEVTEGQDNVVNDGTQSSGTQILIFGTDTYALTVENPLCTTKTMAQAMLANIFAVIGEHPFRAFEGEYIGFPIAEFMDPVRVLDGKGDEHLSFLTDITYSFRGKTSFKCAAEEPLRNSANYKAGSQAYIRARQLVARERTEREKALENLSQQINNSSGLYTTEVTQQDNSVIYYLHNKPTIAESNIIWKMASDAWAVSTNGGQTWNAGVDASGAAIYRILSSGGINADWINAGQLIVRKRVDGVDQVVFFVDVDTGEVRINASQFFIGGQGVAMQSTVDSKVNSVEVQYGWSNDPEIPPADDSSTWGTECPTWQEGRYIWQRTVTTTGNGSSMSEAVCISGAAGHDGEDAILLIIDSSRGNMFKNNAVSTVLSVTIFKGGEAIRNPAQLSAAFGANAYLQWSWKRINDTVFHTIVSTDARLSDGGFQFTISADDVDTKVVFQCDLVC